MVAIVGGSKVSTKLEVLNSLSKIADQIIVGGGVQYFHRGSWSQCG